MTVREVAHLVGACFGREIEIVPGERSPGSTLAAQPGHHEAAARSGFTP